MWYMWYIVWMYHNLWYIIQSKLYNLLFSSLFWAPDHLFCATLVPQIVPQFVALVAQSFLCHILWHIFSILHVWSLLLLLEVLSLYVPQFQAHNLPVPCSSIPFLYYPHLTRPLPSLPNSSSNLYLIQPILTIPSYRSPTLPQPTCLCYTVLKIRHGFRRIIHPQVRPDLVPAVYFCVFFFIYLQYLQNTIIHLHP